MRASPHREGERMTGATQTLQQSAMNYQDNEAKEENFKKKTEERRKGEPNKSHLYYTTERMGKSS